MAKAVCIYFEAHQPNRLKPYSFFDIGKDQFYEDDELNREILEKVSDKCYLPANRLMRTLIDKHRGRFRIAYSLSGVFIEQLQAHRPDVLDTFVDLAHSGSVEMLAETYYHALCFQDGGEEFARQVRKHHETVQEVFHQSPRVFRHTELIYFNELAALVEKLGYEGMLAEGVEEILHGRTPNVLYQSPSVRKMKTLLRNFRLTDDIAFRFSDTTWSEYPLTAEKMGDWIEASAGDCVNLFMDYETIGEHHWEETDIFDFWKEIPEALFDRGIEFKTPAEVIDSFGVQDVYDAHHRTSWADTQKDLSAWRGNGMQTEANNKIRRMEKAVKEHNDPDLLHVWSKLQTSDHFYYMSTKEEDDGDVHSYFSPYPSPYEGYLYFMNALSDLQIRVAGGKAG